MTAMAQLAQALQLASLGVLGYLVVNAVIRRRGWSSLAFKCGTLADLRANLPLVLLVAVVLQLIVPLIGATASPALLRHIADRLPESDGIVPLVLTILVGTLLEELVYRLFLQGMLREVAPLWVSVALASAVFALAHWSVADSWAITLVDVGLVFVDGLIYGIIFARSRNIVLAWGTHAVADLVGLAALLLIV